MEEGCTNSDMLPPLLLPPASSSQEGLGMWEYSSLSSVVTSSPQLSG